MQFTRGLSVRLAAALIFIAGVAGFVPAALAQNVVVEGNTRTDTETITSYFHGTSPGDVNDAVKQLYATGLFSKVDVHREGNRIIVAVAENNLINRVAFEGNTKVKSEQLTPELESKSRGAYNPSTVDADIQRIEDIYRHNGYAAATVTARTVPLPNGRVDVVFTIDEGGKTGVKSIEFVGNKAFSSSRLRDLMQTTEMNFLSWLKSTDIYDPDRLSKDEDLIRRYYLKNGYADFRIVGSDVNYDAAAKGYHIVITVDEGQQYHVSKVDVVTHLPDLDAGKLRQFVRLSPGDVYNGDAVQKSVEEITSEVTKHGYAFASANPEAERDPQTATIALAFNVTEGPRVYIERINIRGNTRTRDYVIRREFDIGEGDAYNKVLIDLAERRLNALGYFKSVKITNEPGSAPDRVIIDVDVEDQPTGAFTISGGYSTIDGFIAEASVSESNFLGRGEYARLAGTLGQYSKGIEFNFTEPYFLGYRMAAGFDLYAKDTTNSQYALYDDFVTGGTLRLGLPVTDNVTFTPHYSIYETSLTIPNDSNRPYNDCNSSSDILNYLNPDSNGNAQYNGPALPAPAINGTTPGTPGYTFAQLQQSYNCLTNGEASLALKQSQGSYLTSLVGYSTSYNSLDNPKNPTQGIYAMLSQDIAGAGGESKFVRTTGEARFYQPLFLEGVVGIVHLQGGDIFGYGGQGLRISDNFNLGPSLVRGFAPGGIGPRDISDPYNVDANSLGGTKYLGASTEIQFPIWGLPKEVGLRGALFADAGTLWGYEGQTNFSNLFPGMAANAPCQPAVWMIGTQVVKAGTAGASPINQGNCIDLQDSSAIRSSAGASLMWASPLGPIRFNYAFVLSKAAGDVTQRFSFSGGSTF